MTRPSNRRRCAPRAIAAALAALCAPAMASADAEDAPWAVGEWRCEIRSNDLPRGPGEPEVADWGFVRSFVIDLQADGTFASRGTSQAFHGLFDEEAAGRWSGGARHWLAEGEARTSRAGEGMPPVIDGSTGEIVEPARPAETWTAPFSAGGQLIGDVLVSASAGDAGPGGIDSFGVCTKG